MGHVGQSRCTSGLCASPPNLLGRQTRTSRKEEDERLLYPFLRPGMWRNTEEGEESGTPNRREWCPIAASKWTMGEKPAWRGNIHFDWTYANGAGPIMVSQRLVGALRREKHNITLMSLTMRKWKTVVSQEAYTVY